MVLTKTQTNLYDRGEEQVIHTPSTAQSPKETFTLQVKRKICKAALKVSSTKGQAPNYTFQNAVEG